MSITGETLTYSTETLTKRSPYQREKDRRPLVLYLFVDSDKLRPVRKSCLDLDVRNHLGHTFHDVFTGKDIGPVFHQFGDRLTVTRTFQHLVGDQRNRLRMV